MDAAGPGRRRAGRPSRALLTRESILDTAFALADERGGDFSVAAIARRLGVQPPAIYNYFSNRADIIAGMRGALGRRIDSSPFDLAPWHEAVLPWARDYLDALGQHPGIVAALATLPIDSEPESIDEYERIVAAFRRDGYPERRIVPALVSIESFIIGSALDAIAPDDNMSPSKAPDLAPKLLRAERLARESAEESGVPMARAVFEFGLAALVDGLRSAGQRETRRAGGRISPPR
ncbi:TetR family transcriptional regulator [Leucobacter weissii]|uniref:TetR family transcriptional regulator n=1 Tax=Leucobacter weissii TaxID=1983706 RepID=A0A939MKP9_9MICO|nr:TetR/AcrR family transcriptional regulator [Leucobacter weissii]MBO1902759.1 TetR family transcriptional regulator [Leucobacter weissii]